MMNPLLDEGLKSAINSIIGVEVVYSQKDLKEKRNTTETMPLSVHNIFQKSSQRVLPVVFETNMVQMEHTRFGISVALMGYHETIQIECQPNDSIETINAKIRAKGISMDGHNALYRLRNLLNIGQVLENCRTLLDYNIRNGCTLHYMYRMAGGGFLGYHIDSSFFDPSFDFDFSRVQDEGKVFTRGGKTYFRPIGSERYAIKVLGQYSDDKWLGSSGDKASGEWPVAYHGTNESNALDIVKQGFDLNNCNRFAHGNGIYCTPDPRTAFKYGTDYFFEGKRYRLIFQVRVDPSQIEVVKPKDDNLGEYWIVPNGNNIRPYGVCSYLNI